MGRGGASLIGNNEFPLPSSNARAGKRENTSVVPPHLSCFVFNSIPFRLYRISLDSGGNKPKKATNHYCSAFIGALESWRVNNTNLK